MANRIIACAFFFLMLLPFGEAQTHQSRPASNQVTIESVSFKGYRQLGYVAPRRSEEIKSSRWGLQFNAPPDEEFLNLLASTGVKWTRIGSRVTVQDIGKADAWASQDKLVNGLVQRKISMFMTVSGAGLFPQMLQKMPAKETLDAWAAYVRTTVQRYKDRVHYWEIWNEPNEHDMPVQIYAELVKRGSDAVRAADPQAKVIGGALSRVDAPYLKALFELGIGPYVDIVSYHPYAELPESNAIMVLQPVRKSYVEASYLNSDLRTIVESVNHPITLWQGECGYPSGDNSGGWQGRGPWGERIQAKWVLRRLLTDFGLGLEVTNAFVLREFEQENRPNTKGFLRADTGVPKPAFSSLAFLTSIFDDRFAEVKKVDTDFTVVEHGTFYGVQGKYPKEQLSIARRVPLPIQVVAGGGAGGDAVAYWIPWRMQELVHPAKVTLKLNGSRIQDPVVVNLLDGNVYQVPVKVNGNEMTFPLLPMADYPFVIVGRSQVKTQSQRFRP